MKRPALHFLFVVIVLDLIFLFKPCAIANAQSQEKIYAVMLLNFARGIQWPQINSSQKFVIGVFEYPPLYNEMRELTTNLKIENKVIEILDLQNAEDVNGCHMVFIPAYKGKVLGAIITKNPTSPLLIVTNKFDLARNGSGINFTLIEGKLKYEINAKAIERRRLKISSNVKGLGIPVD